MQDNMNDSEKENIYKSSNSENSISASDISTDRKHWLWNVMAQINISKSKKKTWVHCESLSVSLESLGIAIKCCLQLNQVLKPMPQSHDNANNK